MGISASAPWLKYYGNTPASLIVAHIYAMYVLAGVFTFGLGMCGK